MIFILKTLVLLVVVFFAVVYYKLYTIPNSHTNHSKKRKRLSYLFGSDNSVYVDFMGLGSPAMEFSIEDDIEEAYHLRMHCGLFGVRVGVDVPPNKVIKYLCGGGHCRYYGFYICDTHINFSWHYDDSGYASHQGWSKLFRWEELLKGKSISRVVKSHGKQIIVVNTLEHPNYPVEEIEVEVWRDDYETTYTRWPKSKWYCYNVRSISGKCESAGKGENSWDCDPEYGIDAIYGYKYVTCANDAVHKAILDLHEIRNHRG